MKYKFFLFCFTVLVTFKCTIQGTDHFHNVVQISSVSMKCFNDLTEITQLSSDRTADLKPVILTPKFMGSSFYPGFCPPIPPPVLHFLPVSKEVKILKHFIHITTARVTMAGGGLNPPTQFSQVIAFHWSFQELGLYYKHSISRLCLQIHKSNLWTPE